MRPLVVVGAGGFGRETLDVIEARNRIDPTWRVLGVVDEAPSEANLDRLLARGVKHLGGLDALRGNSSVEYVVGIGSPEVRARIVDRLSVWGHRAATIIHPAAVIGSQTTIGAGSVVCGGVQLSTNVHLGTHVHVNPGATIGHDSELGDFVSVNPGAIVSGEVVVESESLIGAGAVVLQGLLVGTGATVGAAACVTRDVEVGSVVKGVPAR